MLNQLNGIIEECTKELDAVNSMSGISEIKVKYLGKSGELTKVLRGLKDVPVAEKPAFGKKVNDARVIIEKNISDKETLLKKSELELRMKNETVDITEPSVKPQVGALHPLTIVKNRIVEIFSGLGFEVRQGPEIETDYYNFQALNIPADHPARDMQDTFYFNDNLLLRTHTSPNQARTMEIKKPPIRMICPGKVYRSDDDATHSPMFQQIEGLVVDKNVTMCDLKGVLDTFAKTFFNKDTKTRFRPSYFPFTEPSVEVDVSCAICGGKGCRLCKGTGWIEILGAGVVNPVVLKNSGIDPEVYSGFAFGCGIDRIAMIYYGLPDMRLLFENDSRFLKQFSGK
ncbi:MAG: phenylalanine--tRNA ligase subunit alpha [Christensenellales bacterium]